MPCGQVEVSGKLNPREATAQAFRFEEIAVVGHQCFAVAPALWAIPIAVVLIDKLAHGFDSLLLQIENIPLTGPGQTQGKHRATQGKHRANTGQHRANTGQHRANTGQHRANTGQTQGNKIATF
jgi:hypothetical protein